MAVGRVDAVLQSTDKNFMVPVGGAVACGPDPAFIEQVGTTWPSGEEESARNGCRHGRGSGVMGLSGWSGVVSSES